MSMLVRKGTMLHRNPSRRSTGRRSSRGSISSQRNKGEASSASSTDRESSTSTTTAHNSPARNSTAESTTTTGSPLKTLETRKGNQDGTLHLNKSTTNHHNPEDGNISRRTSSCTSISTDDRRQLYRYSKFAESRDYGSFLSQIREANTESNSGWEFTNKFFTVLCKSAFASVFFIILTILPLSMAFMGIKYLKECPVQPNLPLYLLIGGFCGLVELIWVIYAQVQSRKYEHCDASFFEEDILLGSNTLKLMQWILSGFLVFWFAMGNSWIWGLSSRFEGPPPFVPSLAAPKVWCSEELYLFSISHLYIVYGLAIIFIVFWAACFIISSMRNYQRDK